MSGGDRSWTDGTGGGGTTQGTACESLARRVPLNSPNPSVIATLTVGDELDVRLVVVGERRRIEVVTQQGETAGAITFDGMAQWLDCLARGFRYIAIVQTRGEGAMCIVELRWSGS